MKLKGKVMIVAGFAVLAAATVGFSRTAEARQCGMMGNSDHNHEQEARHDHGEDGDHGKGEKCPMMEKMMMEEGKCPMMEAMMSGEKSPVAKALDSLEAARETLDEGDVETAASNIDEAIEQLSNMKEKCPMMKSDKPMNKECPIMGSEIDPDDHPEDLTRTFQGKTIGFCCPPCLEKWDDLTDEEKKEKLEK